MLCVVEVGCPERCWWAGLRVCGEEIVCQAVGGRMEAAVDENCKERECLPEGDEALVCF